MQLITVFHTPLTFQFPVLGRVRSHESQVLELHDEMRPQTFFMCITNLKLLHCIVYKYLSKPFPVLFAYTFSF